MPWIPSILVSVTAFVASGVNAVAGGGTFLTFPALTGFARLSERLANITSTIGLWPGSAASVAAAWPDFRRLPRAMLVGYSLVSLIGGAAGSWLLLHTTDRDFRLVIPWLLAFA